MIPACIAIAMLISTTSAQDIDSLRKELNIAKGTDQIDVLNKLGWVLRTSDPKQSQSYLGASIRKSKQSDYMPGLAQGYNHMGCALSMDGNQKSARVYLDSALAVFYQLADSIEVAKTMVNYAVSYYYEGQVSKAVDAALEALPYFEKDLARQNKVKSNIAVFYRILGDYESAINMHHQVLNYYRQIGDDRMQVIVINNIASLYFYYKIFDKSLFYYQEGIRVATRKSIAEELANGFQGKGIAFAQMGYIDSAIYYLEKSSHMFDSLNLVGEYFKSQLNLIQWLPQEYYEFDDLLEHHREVHGYFMQRDLKRELIQTKIGLGDLFYTDEQFDSALFYYDFAYEMVELIDDPITYGHVLNKLSRIYEKLGKAALALKLKNQYLEIEDSLFTLETAARLAGVDSRRRYDSLQNKLAVVQDSNYKIQKNNSFLVAGVAFSVFLIFWISYRQYQKKKVINELRQQKSLAIDRYESLENAYANVLELLEEAREANDPSSKPLPDWVGQLSKRELEVLTCISIGMTDKEVSDKLFVSLPTVRTHCRRIYEKLVVKNRSEAASFAREYGLV
jgi:DNA-binding CsgD family transcriptional regulator/tetratricopeptide (TPR) repeat protein